MITVTKPFIPSKELFDQKMKTVFENKWFTNFGPMVNELEDKLKDYFGIEHFLLVTNGTISLQLAIRALDLKGEIITSPFSYVATTSAIAYERCTPVFADIDPVTFNIDPAKIEEKITSSTSAILATHVFGYPCNINAIQKIADKHNLKVIYDSAHIFGTKINGESLLNFGDISSISFHATKLFHSIEGGGIYCKDESIFKKIKLLRNFGHTSPNTFEGIGINAKMNEACAVMGLCNFEYLDEILAKRKSQWLKYFDGINNPRIQLAQYDLRKVEYNYAYFPILFEDEHHLTEGMNQLEQNGIQTRRYFFPSLNTLDYVKYSPCPISEDIAKRICCLPIYHELTNEEQELIIDLINRIC